MGGTHLIRHVFLGTLVEGTSDADVDRLLSRWHGLADTIPGVQALHAGRNVSPRDTRYSVVLVADLDDWAAWEGYMAHPDHAAISSELSSKIIDPKSRAMAQYEF
jgi:heme-degrading monooxygenase HmoA